MRNEHRWRTRDEEIGPKRRPEPRDPRVREYIGLDAELRCPLFSGREATAPPLEQHRPVPVPERHPTRSRPSPARRPPASVDRAPLRPRPPGSREANTACTSHSPARTPASTDGGVGSCPRRGARTMRALVIGGAVAALVLALPLIVAS